jgi:glutamate synthase (NADPH/NADH)
VIIITLTLPIDPREFCISTKDFVMDEDGNVKGLNTVRVEWTKDSGGAWKMEDVPGSERFFPAQLVFLALGFLGPESEVIKALKVKQGPRSNIETPNKVTKCHVVTPIFLPNLQGYSTNVPGVFAAGDCRRGQSLIVWGIKYVKQVPGQFDFSQLFVAKDAGLLQRSTSS